MQKKKIVVVYSCIGFIFLLSKVNIVVLGGLVLGWVLYVEGEGLWS